jgi:N-acetylglucosaminyl-diphospho-decaprenol L-rhamnosyltransferase
MDLSICILTHNQPTLLPRCVEACLSEISVGQVAAEIIVIDNASGDGYPTKLTGLSPLIRIIRTEENLSFSAANNIAIRSSQGRYLLILNDDAVFMPGSLGLMLRGLECQPTVGAIGPRLLNSDGSLQLGFTNRRFPNLRSVFFQTLTLEELMMRNGLTRDALTLVRDPDHSGETEHLAGACLLIRREALDAVGLFDERFLYWYEDVDLCLRLKTAGWPVVYLANAHVNHYGSASFQKRAQAERDAIYCRSLMYFWRKHHDAVSFRIMKLSVAAALLVRTWAGALRRSWRRDLTLEERRAWMKARIGVARILLGKRG